jgi:hypothetical protein
MLSSISPIVVAYSLGAAESTLAKLGCSDTWPSPAELQSSGSSALMQVEPADEDTESPVRSMVTGRVLSSERDCGPLVMSSGVVLIGVRLGGIAGLGTACSAERLQAGLMIGIAEDPRGCWGA